MGTGGAGSLPGVLGDDLTERGTVSDTRFASALRKSAAGQYTRLSHYQRSSLVVSR